MTIALSLEHDATSTGVRSEVSAHGRETPPVTSLERSLPTFDEVYHGHFSHVCRWVRAFGAPPSEVDDLTQEAFLVVRRKLCEFDGRNLGAWLYRITQRTVSDHRRRAWFRRMITRVEGDPDSLPHAGASPLAALERSEAQRTLHRILSRLSTVRRTSFVLFELEGYTAPEIAEFEGIPVNTVYTRLHHARRDFLRLLAEASSDPWEGAP